MIKNIIIMGLVLQVFILGIDDFLQRKETTKNKIERIVLEERLDMNHENNKKTIDNIKCEIVKVKDTISKKTKQRIQELFLEHEEDNL